MVGIVVMVLTEEGTTNILLCDQEVWIGTNLRCLRIIDRDRTVHGLPVYRQSPKNDRI